MRTLVIVAALVAAAAPLRAAAPAAAADWRQAGLPDNIQEALRGLGYRLESDGRILDPKSRSPLTGGELAAALEKLNLATQRLALERLRLLLAKDAPTAEDKAAVRALKGNLPDEVAQALDKNRGASDLRALVDDSLDEIASYFDGARTLGERLDAARPASAGAPGPNAPSPYFGKPERAFGDAVRAAAAARLALDPYGRALLSRLADADGKPGIPEIVVEDLSGGSVALYEYRRRAIVLDREALLDSAVAAAPPKDRPALRARLSSKAALLDYMSGHPNAVAAFAARNDALLFHELIHAWQDRRDPLMREMSRGTIPDVMLLEYEEEAWTMKNLYLKSKLKNDPKSATDDVELADLAAMNRDPRAWRRDLYRRYRDYNPANAMTLRETREVMALRLRLAEKRETSTPDQRRDKALDELALGNSRSALDAALAAQAARLKELRREVESSR